MKALRLSATIILSAALIGAIVYLAVNFQKTVQCISNPFSFIDCMLPSGEQEQGQQCGLDFECKDWTTLGKIACCGNRCITKDFPTQMCSAFLSGEGKPCGTPDGTIWPVSGCDISAGICCKGKCSKECAPRKQGEACTVDPDCAGWTVFGKIACCGSKCVTKARSVQTCPAFLRGDQCTVDSDCAGWSVFGKIACCGNKCVTKASTIQTCPAYLKGKQ